MNDLALWLQIVEEISKLIKNRFPNLSTEDNLKLTHSIVTVVKGKLGG